MGIDTEKLKAAMASGSTTGTHVVKKKKKKKHKKV